MLGLDRLLLVPHILLCVVPPADNIFVHLGSNLGSPQSRYMVLFRIWPSFLMLVGKPAAGDGAAVRVY